jgi:diaminohydroxyphosphoribosylaminopyrimidine deaminase/5-amino-6-(5-phosphoribosylamino)uracil reductase
MSPMKKPENDFSESDIYHMHLALDQAKKGLGRTSPNPCVGAVIVKDDKIISRGYHKKAGGPHAEINALQKAGDKAAGATIYVTLEPCNHTGRTPPCSHAVVAAGIKRVVVGMKDPNPLVNGGGNAYLIEHGLEVLSCVLEKECIEINRPFIKHIRTGRPFIVMKAGMSLDGKLSYQDGVPGNITGEKSHRHLHSLRNTLDAILIGSGTVIADNPSLTTRFVKDGRDPLRVILDSSLRLSLESKILHLESSAPTIIFCSTSTDKKKQELFSKMNGVLVQTVSHKAGEGLNLDEILMYLGKMGICSLLVEGGAAIHSSFLKNALVDRVMLFVAPLFAGTTGTGLLRDFPVKGRDQALKLKNMVYKQYGDDILIQGDF